MIVAGAGGLHEEPVPQVQHQVGRAHARRRLRHDARGADAPLRAGWTKPKPACPPSPTTKGSRRRQPARSWIGGCALPGGPGCLGASASASGHRRRPPASRVKHRGRPRKRGAVAAFMLRADKPSLRDRRRHVAEEFPNRPDLVLIDGGRGQLGVAAGGAGRAGRQRHGAGRHRQGARPRCRARALSTCPARRAHDAGAARPGAVFRAAAARRGPPLRDRHAPGQAQARAIGANPLDEIAGIGPARKRALLKHFGSAKAVSRASTDDLRRVPRHQLRRWPRPSMISSTSAAKAPNSAPESPVRRRVCTR